MSKPVRVKLEATFLMRTYIEDWRNDANLDAVLRVLDAMFEEVDFSAEGNVMGPCTCSMDAEDFMTTGEPSTTDPDCPWHGDRESARD